MKMSLEMPKMIHQAKDTQRGFHWLLESLIFIPVFLVCIIAELIITLPFEVIMIFTNREYLMAMMSGDVIKTMELSQEMATSDAMVALGLFATLGMILVPILYCVLIEKRKLSSLGFVKKDMFKEYGIGLVVGFAVFSIATLICVASGTVSIQWAGGFSPLMLLVFAVGFMFQGMSEEVLCRSYLMVSTARKNPMWVAILVNAFFFMLLHVVNPGTSVLAFVNLFLFGVFASVYFIKRGSIWGVAAIHTIWNFTQGNFYGIRVSGMTMGPTVLSTTLNEGGELMNGGAFGLEGGLAVTIVLVIATIVMLFVPSKESAV